MVWIMGKERNRMKMKQWIALLLSSLLLLGTVACLVPEEQKDPDTQDPTVDVADTSDELDPEAIAVELGNVKITVGELNDTYHYYLDMLANYYGQSIPTDDASIAEYVNLSIKDLVYYYLPEWQADVQGIELTEEEEARAIADTDAQIQYIEQDYLCYYAYYYGGAADYYDDVALLTDEQIDAALTQINMEIAEVYGEGFDFDRYLDQQYENYLKDARLAMKTEKLRAISDAGVTVDDAAVAAWQEAKLAEQQELFASDPLAYREMRELFLNGESTEPLLSAPEGYAFVQVMRFEPEGEMDAAYSTNRTEMNALEAEYGKLVLNGENTARQAEIVTRYRELSEANAALEEAYSGAQAALAKDVHAKLAGGEDFAALMQANGGDAVTERMMSEGELMYLNGTDTMYPAEVTEAVKALEDGAYTEVICVDHVYYIVKRISAAPFGTLDTSAYADAMRAAALLAAQETAWEEQMKAWDEEAHTVAVFHEEAYAKIGH